MYLYMAKKWRQVNLTGSKIIVTINFRHLICFSSLKNMKIARFGDFQLAKVGTVVRQYLHISNHLGFGFVFVVFCARFSCF